MVQRALSLLRWMYAVGYLRCQRQWRGWIDPSYHAVGFLSVVLSMQLVTVAFVARVLGLNLWTLTYAPYGVLVAVLINRFIHVRFVKHGDADELIKRLRHRTRAKARRDEVKELCIGLGLAMIPFAVGLVSRWAGWVKQIQQ